MSSFLLGLTMIAVIWLVFWSGKDHSRPSKTWWLFAMREPHAAKSKDRGSGYTVQATAAPQAACKPEQRHGAAPAPDVLHALSE